MRSRSESMMVKSCPCSVHPDSDGDVLNFTMPKGSRPVGFDGQSVGAKKFIFFLCPSPHPKESEGWEVYIAKTDTLGEDPEGCKDETGVIPEGFEYLASYHSGGAYSGEIHHHVFVRQTYTIPEKAFFFAMKAHGGQVYGDKPYWHHLKDVRDVLRGMGWFKSTGVRADDLHAAAFLHDVVEDTEVTIEEVEARFGHEVARLVSAVTNEPGRNREARHVATYPKIKKAGKQALALKLADRIANTENCIKDSPQLMKMYRREFPAFREALHTPGELTGMWKWLDKITHGRD